MYTLLTTEERKEFAGFIDELNTAMTTKELRKIQEKTYLKFHPDRNNNDPDCTELSKKFNNRYSERREELRKNEASNRPTHECSYDDCHKTLYNKKYKFCQKHRCRANKCYEQIIELRYEYCINHICNKNIPGERCNEQRDENKKYCKKHVCPAKDCNLETDDGLYCAVHKCKSHSCNNRKYDDGGYCISHKENIKKRNKKRVVLIIAIVVVVAIIFTNPVTLIDTDGNDNNKNGVPGTLETNRENDGDVRVTNTESIIDKMNKQKAMSNEELSESFQPDEPSVTTYSTDVDPTYSIESERQATVEKATQRALEICEYQQRLYEQTRDSKGPNNDAHVQSAKLRMERACGIN